MKKIKGSKRSNKKNILIYILSIIALILICLLIISVKVKLDNKKEIIDKVQIHEVKKFNDNNRKIALLSKPFGSDIFNEITSTPTSGLWTITTNCKGMSVTWDNDDYTLDVEIIQTPASCKVNFIEYRHHIGINVVLNGEANTVPSFGYYTTNLSCTEATGTYSSRYRNITLTTLSSTGAQCNLTYNDFTPAASANLITTIKALASPSANTSVASGTNGKLHTITSGTNAHIRYTGQEPNNYVWYNNEMWRIIGVVPAALTSGATTTTSLVKIIRNDSLGGAAYDAKESGYTGAWGSNTLYTLLNTYYWGKADGTDSVYCYGYKMLSKIKCDYEEKGINPNDYYGKMVQTVYWNTAAVATGSTVATAYTAESAKRTVQGNIGLMSYSDYGYAADSSNYSIAVSSYQTLIISITNWIFKDNDQWTLSQLSSNSLNPWFADSSGGVSNFFASYEGASIKPVVYLENDVYVVSGDGTRNSPYILGQ